MALTWVTQLFDAGLITASQMRSSEADKSDARSPDVMGKLVEGGLDDRTLAGFFVSLGFGPMLQARELARADGALLGRLPPELAHRCCAVPLRSSPAGAVVAMADPTDEASVREISEALGERILPTAARLGDLLEALRVRYPRTKEHLGAPVPNPSAVMPLLQDKPPLENASLSDASSVERTQPGFPATGSPVWDRAWDRSVQATAHRGTVQGAHRGMSDPAPQAAARPVELDLSSLQNVGSRDELVQAACEAGLVYARGVGFVTLRKGVFRGWGGAGEHLTEAGIRSLWVPATNPSALNEVAHSGVGSRGFYGQTAADQLLRTALGGEGREVLIAPVRVGDRILGLLCADDPGPDAESLDEIAKAMGYGFERLIVARKLDH